MAVLTGQFHAENRMSDHVPYLASELLDCPHDAILGGDVGVNINTEEHHMRAYAIAVIAIVLSASTAGAVSQAVKTACSGDYHAHCDKLEVGSPELRSCMRRVASKLSKGCIQALVDNKEVTQADIEEYRAQTKAKN
jgi:hypothetical protein